MSRSRSLETLAVAHTIANLLTSGFSYSGAAVDKISTDTERRAVPLRVRQLNLLQYNTGIVTDKQTEGRKTREINSFGWYNDTVKNSSITTKTKRAYTRSQRTASLTEYTKSALTDHANQANHTIDWKKTTVIDREQDRYQGSCTYPQVVHIRKEGHRAMNRDEDSYRLSHAYDRFLDATADRRFKTRKN